MVFTSVADAHFVPRAASSQISNAYEKSGTPTTSLFVIARKQRFFEACHNNAQKNGELKGPQNP
jgi:hypothetical protein